MFRIREVSTMCLVAKFEVYGFIEIEVRGLCRVFQGRGHRGSSSWKSSWVDFEVSV
jgi:hypothetical protein